MKSESVNFQLLKPLWLSLFGGLLMFGQGATGAAPSPPLKQMVEDRVACDHTAQMIEQELSDLSDDQVAQVRARLKTRLPAIQACLQKGQDDHSRGEILWRQRWQEANRRSRVSNALLHEAALRSTVLKLLRRTDTRISKIEARIAGASP